MRGERRFLSGAGWPEFPRFNWWGRKRSKREASTQESLLPPGAASGARAAWRAPPFLLILALNKCDIVGFHRNRHIFLASPG